MVTTPSRSALDVASRSLEATVIERTRNPAARTRPGRRRTGRSLVSSCASKCPLPEAPKGSEVAMHPRQKRTKSFRRATRTEHTRNLDVFMPLLHWGPVVQHLLLIVCRSPAAGHAISLRAPGSSPSDGGTTATTLCLLEGRYERGGASMKLRIVVADERRAIFFDASRAGEPLTARGSMQNEAGGLKDIDLETDRKGRRFGGASGIPHGDIITAWMASAARSGTNLRSLPGMWLSASTRIASIGSLTRSCSWRRLACSGYCGARCRRPRRRCSSAKCPKTLYSKGPRRF